MGEFELDTIGVMFISPLLIGFLLDSLIGDPYKMPHPIRWFGSLIQFGDKKLNVGSRKKIKGLLLVVALVVVVTGVLWYVNSLLVNYYWLKLSFESIMVFYGIANRSLIVEALKVEKKLVVEGVESAREQLRYIVGRDTKELNHNQIRIATLETLSENLSDGVVAPLFYYFIGGIPLMFAYKLINTMDSMLGYKNTKYKDFGLVAAKLDDVVNYIPARITAFLMVVITFSWRGFKFIFKYGNKHSSPNAGYPEAALAGILNCQFGGANYYGGKLVEKPVIGTVVRAIHHRDVVKASLINVGVTFLFIVVIFIADFYI